MKRFLFTRIEVWVLCLVMILGLSGLIAFGGLVLLREWGSSFAGVIGRAAHSVAELPLVLKRINEPDSRVCRWSKRFDAIPSGWSFGEAGRPGALDGYVLLSRIDGNRQRAVVELVDLSDMAVVHTWLPNVEELLAVVKELPENAEKLNWARPYFRFVHPFIHSDGGLTIKNHDSPLIRTDACSRPLWAFSKSVFSHSTEVDANGDYWLVAHPDLKPDSRWAEPFSNDSLARVSADGHLVELIDLAEVFESLGHFGRLFPVNQYIDDPLHLNDIQPVLKDGPHWKKGDLFLSLREPSIIMLYRPSSDEILWMKDGPWLKQHDVDILDDHRISVFSNNTRNYGSGTRVEDAVDVMIYDFSNGEVTMPWRESFRRLDIETSFEGLAQLLPDGNLMVEETHSGRLLIMDKDGAVLGQFLNRADDGQVYVMAWSRYIEPTVGDALVKVLQKVDCNG